MTFPTLTVPTSLGEVASGNADVTVPLPSGSGGKLWLLVMSYYLPSATATAFSTPSGWTKEGEIFNENAFGDTFRSCALYSSTTATSDPTVTRTGTAGVFGGAIVRINGGDTAANVSLDLRTRYSSAMLVNSLSDDATLDTLKIYVGMRPVTGGVFTTSPPPTDWTDDANLDGGSFKLVVGDKHVAGAVSDELMYAELNTTTAWAEFSLSVADAAGGGDAIDVDVAAVAPAAVGAADFTGEDDVLELTQNDVSITIQGAAGIEYGQHRNSAGYGIHCDRTILITASFPTPTTIAVEGDDMHGVELMPEVVADAQGFDSRRSGYDAELNLGPGIETTPLDITALVTEAGRPLSIIKVGSRLVLDNVYPTFVATVDDVAIFTFYPDGQYPADIANTYRPSYHSVRRTETPRTYSDVFTGRLRSHNLTTLANPLSSGAATAINAVAMKAQLHRIVGTWDDYWHPANHMRNYSRDFAQDWGSLRLVCNSTQKNTAGVDSLIQLGIDLDGYFLSGGAFRADGGEGMGRRGPIRFAGWLLNDAGMYYLTHASYPGGDAPVGLTMQFQENGNLFWVGAVDVGRTVLTGAGRATYDESHVGLPEWGLQHYYYPNEDNSVWDGPPGYRRCCTFKSSCGDILADQTMGIPCSEDDNPVDPLGLNPLRLQQAYMQRYLDTETPLGTTWLPPAWERDAWAAYLNDLPSTVQLDVAAHARAAIGAASITGGPGVAIAAAAPAAVGAAQFLTGVLCDAAAMAPSAIGRARFGSSRGGGGNRGIGIGI